MRERKGEEAMCRWEREGGHRGVGSLSAPVSFFVSSAISDSRTLNPRHLPLNPTILGPHLLPELLDLVGNFRLHLVEQLRPLLQAERLVRHGRFAVT